MPLGLLGYSKTPRRSGSSTTGPQELGTLQTTLGTADGVVAQVDRLRDGWMGASPERSGVIETVGANVARLPDVSEQDKAKNFLTLAEDRVRALRQAERDLARKKAANAAARDAHKAYSDSATQTLEGLYKAVQEEFQESYRALNSDDEGGFSAAFRPDGSKLELEVDFYGRGEFSSGRLPQRRSPGRDGALPLPGPDETALRT